MLDGLGLAADGLTVPNPALSVAVACSAWTAVWNVGRVAAKVEVTSSRGFLFIFLFPEFHCYYSNKPLFQAVTIVFSFRYCGRPRCEQNVNFRNAKPIKDKNLLTLRLFLVVCCLFRCTFQSPAVFLPVYLDFISMMPIEPPGNNWLSACFKLIALSLACRDQYWY